MRNTRMIPTWLGTLVLLAGLSVPAFGQTNSPETLYGRLSFEYSRQFSNGKLYTYWVRTLRAGVEYTISANSKDFDTFLQIEDAGGSRVFVSDDDGGHGLNSRLTFIPRETANYRVVVTSYNRADTGTFTLRIEPEAPVTTTFGRLSTNSPRDKNGKYYQEHSVNIGRQGWITLDVSSGDFDTYIRLYDSRGNLIDWNDDIGTGTNSRIRFYANAPGDYWLQVTSYRSYETGNYKVHLTR